MRWFIALLGLTVMGWAADSNAPVTFTKDVLPILQRNCQECHRPGNIAPMSFLTYESSRPWAKAIKAAVSTRKMPPWFADPQYGHFSNDRSLSKADIETITIWADGGAPQGDAKDAPPPLHFAENGSDHTTRHDSPGRAVSRAGHYREECCRVGHGISEGELRKGHVGYID